MGSKKESQAKGWRDFRSEFEQLAREEEGAEPDHRLCASCDYTGPPAILDEKGKPQQRPLCVIRAPKNGLWTLNSGVSEGFVERFRTLAARAGRALGARKSTDPAGVWLHRLYSYMRESNSELLGPKIGGRTGALRHIDTVLRICQASGTFCSRLERKAVIEARAKSKSINAAAGAKVRIGQNIQKLRKECFWSLDTLAHKTGIDKKAILSHVHGKSKPNPGTQREYAQAFTKELNRPITANNLEE
jgi:DNA-binding XRE family transcriptional regulator